ncbi:GNAT family N-acetyltransferase [Kroppenstedtia eburnea]|uniref:Ribosomal-protein-serine acetyltransferase n=1 Tax=Kroppenstedtia eburnea TaxID=714067 RepID=A0A1N7NDT4_9BACL|nr:GNAT family protein [Kroppenstedtia eburnea]EGK11926.1 ribosomal-protein-serine acetyltransferase [Desmospora sp. 8437]QKI83059.1 GNAT family N-acetyltransferase [Kroppenstedtia eburnea]SIS96401.1 ribosomal-protein-serine acetyltransferase [Kroppenstedtia eburnea]
MELMLQAGEDLRLHLFHSQHAQALHRLVEANRSHLEPWLPWIRTVKGVQEIERYIRRTEAAFASGREAHFGIWHRGVLGGSVTVERIDSRNQVAEIGYWLGRELTGDGLMTRSVRRVSTYLFQERNIHRIEIRVEATNHASRRVALRAGFMEEGILREALWTDPGRSDLVIHGLLRPEFP